MRTYTHEVVTLWYVRTAAPTPPPPPRPPTHTRNVTTDHFHARLVETRTADANSSYTVHLNAQFVRGAAHLRWHRMAALTWLRGVTL
jgi:hypothetical protein